MRLEKVTCSSRNRPLRHTLQHLVTLEWTNRRWKMRARREIKERQRTNPLVAFNAKRTKELASPPTWPTSSSSFSWRSRAEAWCSFWAILKEYWRLGVHFLTWRRALIQLKKELWLCYDYCYWSVKKKKRTSMVKKTMLSTHSITSIL